MGAPRDDAGHVVPVVHDAVQKLPPPPDDAVFAVAQVAPGTHSSTREQIEYAGVVPVIGPAVPGTQNCVPEPSIAAIRPAGHEPPGPGCS